MRRFSLLLAALILNLQSPCAQDTPPPFRVDVRGSGEPVLFLPGFSCPGAVWEDTIRELETEYECHVFTYAGFGGTDPIGFPWLPQLRDGIHRYMTEKGLTKARLVGHSMGGTLALWLGTMDDLEPTAIVVVDGLPAMGALMIPDYKSENIRYDSPWNRRILAMGSSEFDVMAEGMAAGMASDSLRQQQIAGWIRQCDRETYVYGYTDLLKLDLRGQLPQVRAPVHILAATHPFGEDAARKNYMEQYAGLDGYTLEFAPDAAHFVMFDQPVWFNRTLKEIFR